MPNPRLQKGATMLITLLVLAALTLFVLSASNSNTMQILMVGNRQHQLEVWNAAYQEIQAQLNYLNQQATNNSLSIHLPGQKIDLTVQLKHLPPEVVVNSQLYFLERVCVDANNDTVIDWVVEHLLLEVVAKRQTGQMHTQQKQQFVLNRPFNNRLSCQSSNNTIHHTPANLSSIEKQSWWEVHP